MNPVGTHRMEITTADAVSFHVQLATPVARALALGVDVLVILGIQSILQGLFHVLVLFDEDLFMGLLMILFFVLNFAYFMLTEWKFTGQTFGKRVLGLRVIDSRARRLAGSQVVVRNLFRVIDMFPMFYVVGGLGSLFSPKFQRPGDLAAGTLVIRLPRGEVNAGTDRWDRKYNSFRGHPQVEGRLRRETTPEEVALLVEALTRRDRLDAEARIAAYRELRGYFERKIRFPLSLTEELGDEAFLRNLLDSLTRNQREL
ncbi:MAG: RDD family protein [Verrucomicrobia bacterium]|nr:RDD family protein [Verrucomicrobiota bacterium]MCH8526485.1 RDD family protein [Kiritimatiellia bacterium]